MSTATDTRSIHTADSRDLSVEARFMMAQDEERARQVAAAVQTVIVAALRDRLTEPDRCALVQVLL